MLWQGGGLTARQVREMLAKRRPMSHSSVCTLLNRLSEKGIAAKEKGPSGKAFVYSATVAPAKSRQRVVGDVLDRVFQGSGVDLVTSLLETSPPTEEELAQLQALLDGLKSKRSKRGTKRKGKS